jgi:hypothetical protein
MVGDAIEESKVAHNLNLLCDMHTLLTLPCVMPLFELVNQLIEFVQLRNIFVTNSVHFVHICQKQRSS